MNNIHETINLIGKWICLIACVAASIYFATQGKNDYASGFGFAAFWAYWLWS
jgi:hypothetical protein